MITKQMKLLLTATAAILTLLKTASAYMSPMPMSPMMGGGMMNPMNPYGYHVARKRRHRNFFQRLTGTGRRYKYYVRPNSYMHGMPGSPMMNPMGSASYHATSYGMHPMGMGGMHAVTSPMGVGGMGASVTTVSVNGAVPGVGLGMGGFHSHMSPMIGMSGIKDVHNTVRSASALSHACRSNNTNTLRHVSCPYMTQHDLHYCFTRASEPFLSALVRKCKGVFTSNPYQMAAYGVELILANKSMPFGSIFTRNTCLMMGAYEKKVLLKTAIMSRTQNSYAFVDHILNVCNIPLYMISRLQTVALISGDMSVAMRLQRAAMYPAHHHHVQQVVYVPSGRAIYLANGSALANLNGRDMTMFGKIGRVCSLLRPEHITHPLFNPELLSEMSENCFKHLKPRLFWYMTSDMIKRFRWWRSAKPEQIHWVPIGKPIQAVPFFLLGEHPYVNKLDRNHPCAGITKTHRISIQMEPKTARAFYERCRASSAMAIKASATLIISALLTYFVFVS